jgi:hypothetical protein
MNMKKLFLSALCALGLVAPAMSQNYGEVGTFWQVTNFTNNPAVATNLNAMIDVRYWDYFTLQVTGGLTNASTGSLDIQWCQSGDGSNFDTCPSAGIGSGWFRSPTPERRFHGQPISS